MSATIRFSIALALLSAVGGSRSTLTFARREEQTKKKFLAVLMRTGGPQSAQRLESIRKTWARDLEDGALILLQPDAGCKAQFGDNHWQGLTCLEAKNHVQLMNRTDFEWLLVVDDDTYVFPDRLRETLRQMDASKEEVYGAPFCGDCGQGRKGFCGGGGYVLSRQSLLKLASSTTAPVSRESGEAFVQHMMSPPNSEWCDVRFACVVQDKGLKVVGVEGLYGNGIIDSNGKLDEAEESKVVALSSQKFKGPPLVLHKVQDASHMQLLYEESLKEKKKMWGKHTGYNADGVKGFVKWIFMQMTV